MQEVWIALILVCGNPILVNCVLRVKKRKSCECKLFPLLIL